MKPNSRTHAALTFIVAVAIFAACASTDSKPASQSEPWVGGWLTYWDFNKGIETLDAQPGLFTDIYLFIMHMNAEGRPSLVKGAENFPELVTRLRTQGIRLWMTVVNDVVYDNKGPQSLKNAAVVSRLLNDDDSRRRHRADIVRAVELYGFDGIDIDYENLLPQDREPFSRFIAELATDLHGRNKKLSVTVQPKFRESRSVGTGAADWAALCRATDRMQIMLYNEHSGNTSPGPIATKEWMGHVLAYAEQQCGRSKVVPVVKVAGMRWSEHGTQSVAYDEVAALLASRGMEPERDTEDKVPHFAMTVDGERSTVYYEDVASVGAKLDLLHDLGYRSVMIWSLGRYDPRINSALRGFAGSGSAPR